MSRRRFGIMGSLDCNIVVVEVQSPAQVTMRLATLEIVPGPGVGTRPGD